MDTNLIKSAVSAFKDFVAAVGNDVCNDENSEYVIFNGQVAADNKGNVKTYALVNANDSDEPKKVLVAQVPLRPILNNLANFANSMVDLYENDHKEANRKAEEEAKTENAEIEAENAEIENKISDLESQISNLKLRKKSVRHYVKRF